MDIESRPDVLGRVLGCMTDREVLRLALVRRPTPKAIDACQRGLVGNCGAAPSSLHIATREPLARHAFTAAEGWAHRAQPVTQEGAHSATDIKEEGRVAKWGKESRRITKHQAWRMATSTKHSGNIQIRQARPVT